MRGAIGDSFHFPSSPQPSAETRRKRGLSAFSCRHGEFMSLIVTGCHTDPLVAPYGQATRRKRILSACHFKTAHLCLNVARLPYRDRLSCSTPPTSRHCQKPRKVYWHTRRAVAKRSHYPSSEATKVGNALKVDRPILLVYMKILRTSQ